LSQVACVVCALVLVVAVGSGTADTSALAALVRGRALVTVIASQVVGHEVAAGFGDAGVVGADVVVVACDRITRRTLTALARVSARAQIPVLALGAFINGNTTLSVLRVAHVICARIAVILADHRCAGNALPGLAQSSSFAHAHVPARGSFIYRDAADLSHGVADIYGALVTVVLADYHLSGDTDSHNARLLPVAEISVGARSAVFNGRIALPGFRIAQGLETRVLQAGAIYGDSRTGSLCTLVVGGAKIPVVAGRGVVD